MNFLRTLRPWMYAAGLAAGAAQAQTPPQTPTNMPFELKMTVQERVTTGGNCPAFSVAFTGSGYSPQVGALTAEGAHCATPDAQGNLVVPQATMTMTTDAGDRLLVNYVFVITAAQTAPIYDIWGSFEIVGGTGKYAKASGRGIAHGLDRVMPEELQAGPAIVEAKGAWRF